MSVWVQLYYKGKGERKGQPVKIEPIPKNIGALAKAAKAELKPKIDYAPLNEIFVFSPNTERPFSQEKATDPGDYVPTGTTSKKPFIVVAPDPPEQLQSAIAPSTIDLELCLTNKKPVKVSLNEDEQTMDRLELLTRDRFDIPVARLVFKLPNGLPVKSDRELQALPLHSQTKLTVSETRVAFSSISTVKDALKLLGQNGDTIPIDDNAFPEPKQIRDDDGELLHAVSTLKRLQDIVPLPQGCEATRRLYIDPILLASARIAGEVKVQVEKVYENPDVCGPVDYVFKLGDETICVTEGKKDNLDGGVIQNIAQLSAVSYDRKRKFSEISAKEKPIYGIVTTYLEWSFLVLNKGVVTQTKILTIKDGDKNDVGGMIGRIVAILKEGKKSE